ncbi:MAG: hypothetical protein GW802_35165 [Armatimonadetes bacterium]|nr:hypothetical protein [Armatimonadota bacterium]
MHHPQLEVTVGAEGTTFKGLDDLAIQAAIDYVAARGGAARSRCTRARTSSTTRCGCGAE